MRAGERESGAKLLQLQQEIKNRDKEQERLVQENQKIAKALEDNEQSHAQKFEQI